jgi:hypothetical protein
MEDMLVNSGPIVVLNKPKANSALGSYALSVYQGYSASAVLTNPNPTMPVFKAHIDALIKIDATPGATGAQKGAARRLVNADLKHLQDYAQGVVDTVADPAAALVLIESINMRARRFTRASKPALAAKHGKVSGDVTLVAKAVRGGHYYWSFSLDGKVWVSLPDTTKATTSLTGLTVAQLYYFRFRTLSRAGLADFSQAVTLMVL